MFQGVCNEFEPNPERVWCDFSFESKIVYQRAFTKLTLNRVFDFEVKGYFIIVTKIWNQSLPKNLR